MLRTAPQETTSVPVLMTAAFFKANSFQSYEPTPSEGHTGSGLHGHTAGYKQILNMTQTFTIGDMYKFIYFTFSYRTRNFN